MLKKKLKSASVAVKVEPSGVASLEVKSAEGQPSLAVSAKVDLSSKKALEARVAELEGDLRRLVQVLAKEAGGQYQALLLDIVDRKQGA